MLKKLGLKLEGMPNLIITSRKHRLVPLRERAQAQLLIMSCLAVFRRLGPAALLWFWHTRAFS